MTWYMYVISYSNMFYYEETYMKIFICLVWDIWYWSISIGIMYGQSMQVESRANSKYFDCSTHYRIFLKWGLFLAGYIGIKYDAC